MKIANTRCIKTTTIWSLARLWLATLLILNACDSGGGGGGYSGNGEKYGYCVFMERQTCLSGPFEACANGGTPSNSCPTGYDTGSQIEKPSSSSKLSGISSSSTTQQTGKIEGSPITYQGKTYKTVVIGNQVWMAENLNYNVSGSLCYGNLESNCNIYGRLYNWETAMSVCPSGWHLPSNEEWDMLINYAGGVFTAGKKLKAISSWNSGGNGTDNYGFAALPGGSGDPIEGLYFIGVGSIGYWWSSIENDIYNAHQRRMNYNGEDVIWNYFDKTYLLSVRCIKN
jgi:uncharacterized protein (TIGR02145 family)